MSKIYFSILLLLLSTSAFAQSEEIPGSGKTHTQDQDSIFAPLDKSRIPYGILYDRVFPFAGLTTFADGDTVTTARWIQAFSELQRAGLEFEPDSTVLNHTNVRDFIFSENVGDRLPLLVLNARFASIDLEAYNDGRLVHKDGLVYDAPRTASPYLEHSVVMPVLAFKRKIYTETSYTMYFSTAYDFGAAAGDEITGITLADVTTDESWDIPMEGEETIEFADSGLHVIRITVTSEEGEKTFTQLIHVTAKATAGACESPIHPIESHPYLFQGYDESSASQGHGEWQIFFGTRNGGCDGKLMNPVIIVDAWDPGDERSIERLYNEKLAYDDGTNDRNLGQDLRDQGYDIVVLNFVDSTYLLYTTQIYIPFLGWKTFYHYRDGGVDYIERNAMILAKLIEEINGTLVSNGSDKKLVVVGPSMGGQISRYALRWMERMGKNHNTRLWISFDSPHLGANIPYGMQESLRYIYRKFENESAGEFYNRQLRAPAGRQMLIHQTSPDYGFTGINTVQANTAQILFTQGINNEEPFRKRWRDTLGLIGYPQNLRKISLVNGTYKGGHYHNPGDRMYQMKVRSYQTWIDLLMADVHFMKGTSSKVLEFWKFGNGVIRSFSTNIPTVYGPLDGIQGGMYDVQEELYKSDGDTEPLKHIGPWNYIVGETKFYHRTHNACFIPTVSGLGLNSSNFDWSQALDISYLRCNSGMVWDNVFVPEQNENHVNLTPANVAWLMSEINPPNYQLTNVGPVMDCSTRTITLTPAPPSGSTISAVSSNTSALTVLSVSGNSILVQGVSANPGVTLTVTVTEPNCVVRAPITATIPVEDYDYGIQFILDQPGCNFTAHVTYPKPGSSYYWSFDGVSYTTTSSPTFGSYFPQANVNIPVYLKVVTPCNDIVYRQTAFTIEGVLYPPPDIICPYYAPPPRMHRGGTGEEDPNRITVAPNPTTADWSVFIYNNTATSVRARLTDVTGREFWSKLYTEGAHNNGVTVPGNALPPGVYFLQVKVDGKEQQFKLVKQ